MQKRQEVDGLQWPLSNNAMITIPRSPHFVSLRALSLSLRLRRLTGPKGRLRSKLKATLRNVVGLQPFRSCAVALAAPGEGWEGLREDVGLHPAPFKLRLRLGREEGMASGDGGVRGIREGFEAREIAGVGTERLRLRRRPESLRAMGHSVLQTVPSLEQEGVAVAGTKSAVEVERRGQLVFEVLGRREVSGSKESRGG